MKLSASSVARINECPGSWALENLVEQQNRYNAFEGAASFGRSCHAAGESILKTHIEGGKLTVKQALKKEGITDDDRAVDIVKYYAAYIKALLKTRKPHEIFIEEKFRTEVAGVDCVFKCDFMSVQKKGDDVHIDIADLKTGNYDYEKSAFQQMEFSVVLYMVLNRIKAASYTMHIIQPHYFNEAYHVRIQSSVFSRSEACTFLIELIASLLSNQSIYNVGSQCAFCPGIVRCPAVTNLVKIIAERTLIGEQIEEVNHKQLASLFMAKQAISAYMSAVEQVLTSTLQSGKSVDGVWLKPGFGHRYYPAPAEVEKAFAYLGDELYEKKVKGPAQLEKIVGKSNLAGYVDKQQRFSLAVREDADNPFLENK